MAAPETVKTSIAPEAVQAFFIRTKRRNALLWRCAALKALEGGPA